MNSENIKIEKEQSKLFLHPEYSKGFFSIFIFSISLVLAFINAVFKSSDYVGFWDVISYLLLLMPLCWMIIKKKLNNRYTLWFIPFILILIVDMFIYNNTFSQNFLPKIIFVSILVLYLTCMQNVSSFYQTLIPHQAIPFKTMSYVKLFFENFMTYKEQKSIYNRIGLALLITIPFIALFLTLFMSADINFNNFIKSLFHFNLGLDFKHIFTIPFYLIIFLLIFIYSFSNEKKRDFLQINKPLDPLIIGIFLGMLNLLFIIFLVFQINYLFGGELYIKNQGINIAQFAREGFFQLMGVMGIVLTIFLLIMSRYQGEKNITYLICGLILSTMIIGFSSLKKMYLYQSLLGATVLRYYVEWFDYFLLIVLGIGVIFVFKRKPFYHLLNIVVIIGLISFTIVSSINVDKIVASHNIEKFKNTPSLLDKEAISELSIDVLPILYNYDYKSIFSTLYLTSENRRNCSSLKEYHYGYCKLINEYGSAKILSFYRNAKGQE